MKHALLLAGLVCFLMAGCSTMAGNYEANPIIMDQSTLLKHSAKGTTEDVVDNETLVGEIRAATTVKLRNKLMMDLISISDRVCSRHQAGIISNANSWNIITGTAVNVFSGLGTVVNGLGSKTALAAGSAVSSSTRSLVNEELYAKMLASTIVRGINTSREKTYAELKLGMKKTLDEYPASEAVRDIAEYHRRCSFYMGMLEVTKAMEQRKKSKPEIEADIAFLEGQLSKADEAGNATISTKLNALRIEYLDAPR